MPTNLTDMVFIGLIASVAVLVWVLYRSQQQNKYVSQISSDSRRHADMLEVLSSYEHALSGDLELDPLCEKIVSKLSELSRFPYVSLYMLEDHAMKLRHAAGIEKPVEEFPANQGVSARIIRSGKTEHLTDIDEDPLFSRTTEQVAASVWIPVADSVQVIGALVIGLTPEIGLTRMDVTLAERIGDNLKVHISRVKLHMEMSSRGFKYQSVIDNVDEVIFQTDDAGYWSFLNPAWTVYTGESVEQSLGASVLEFVHPEDQRAFLHVFSPILSGQSETCRSEFRIVHEEDRVIWVEMHARPVRNEDGDIRGVFGTLFDISDRKSRESERTSGNSELLASEEIAERVRPEEGGKILMMDDERIVRSLVSDILTHSGYEVVLTEDGQAAVDAYVEAGRSGAPFDAVILDLTVPGGMGGKDALNRIMMSDPQAQVIVSSGYVNNPILANYRKYGFIGMVPKPYQADQLTGVLQQVISTGQVKD
ncbi:MAG: PAS domain S-box protein [Candidatus Latescibacteria bacterium]|nr:PAS domain S-box protein [Candidatus Latescibacterota bacterium]